VDAVIHVCERQVGSFIEAPLAALAVGPPDDAEKGTASDSTVTMERRSLMSMTYLVSLSSVPKPLQVGNQHIQFGLVADGGLGTLYIFLIV
jgi:hypothetical protein